MDSETYFNNKHIFLKYDTLYVLGDFNQDISNNVIPEMNDIINRLSLTKDPSFEIVINSYGGYVHELFSLLYYIDIMKSLGVKIITKVIGAAHSCASMLACYGDERYMYKYSEYLMHFGTYSFPDMKTFEDINRWSQGSKMHFDKIIDIYMHHSSLKREQIIEMLSSDLILSAEKCLEYNLCDHII